jgi:glutathione S-transferase
MPQRPLPQISLFELGPTRSSRARWALLEAELGFTSLGNTKDVFRSEALRRVHPLAKLPAMLIDGKPLFESSAIVTAIADLVPEKDLIAAPGTWGRNLHYQWVSFVQSEMEAHANSAEINSIDFVLPKQEHVPAIKAQNEKLYRDAAAALDEALGKSDFLVEDRFSVTDIFAGYAVNWGDEFGWLEGFSNLRAYLERLFARKHCTLVRYR